MGRLRTVVCLIGACLATGAVAAPAASGSTLSSAITSFLQSLTPRITQVSPQICLATPSATVALTNPVTAGDTLVLVVAGQGYSAAAPVVTGVSDNVNGAWTQLTNAPNLTADGLRYLSYSVYEMPSTQAAPNGLTITVNQVAGQSSASVIAFEVNSKLRTSAFNDSSLLQSANGVMSAPQTSSWNNPLNLTIGVFGAYEIQQTFTAGSGWTMNLVQNCTAAAELSSGPMGGTNWSGLGTAPVPTVDVNAPTYYMAGTLEFGFSLSTLLSDFPQLKTLLASNPQLLALLESYS